MLVTSIKVDLEKHMTVEWLFCEFVVAKVTIRLIRFFESVF